jgi:hypothetical protein
MYTKMGYQIYVKESLPDGPCDPEKEIRFDHGCISGWDLDSVPGVCAFGVDGHNALDTAHKVRAWASKVKECLDWIREQMAAECTVTLTLGGIIKASSPDGMVTAYRVKQLVEQCRGLKEWSTHAKRQWTPEDACFYLECEIEGLIMMAEWLEKHVGKTFDHSY